MNNLQEKAWQVSRAASRVMMLFLDLAEQAKTKTVYDELEYMAYVWDCKAERAYEACGELA